MAYRVQTNAELNFGTAAAEVVVTHVRFQQSDNTEPVTKALSASVTFAAGRDMTIAAGDLDILYLAGDLTNDHMAAVVNPYWTGVTFKIDLLTAANTVVADGGYGQQTYSAWQFSTENDP